MPTPTPTPTPTPYATAFTTQLSQVAGPAGTTVNISAIPNAAWDASVMLTLNVAGLTGTASPSLTQLAPTYSAAPVSFSYTVTSAAGTAGTFGITSSPALTTQGPQSFTVISASGAAFSYDILVGASSATPGASVPISVVPRGGTFPSGTIALSAASASFGSAGGVLTMTSGSTTPLTTTIIAGPNGLTATVTGTNPAGLINPFPRTVTCFAASAGTAGTIVSAALAGPVTDNRHYGREIHTGNPTGWSTTWNKGWAPVQIVLNAAVASQALYARAYDRASQGASATAVGTGTLVQNWVQVFGPIHAGSQTITIAWPASPDFHYMELSLDAAGAQPIRLVNCLSAGDESTVLTRSSNEGLGNAHPEGLGGTPPNYTLIVPYTKGVTSTIGADGKFHLQDGIADYVYKTAGAMEYCRIMAARTGVTHAIVGYTPAGGNINDQTQSFIDSMLANIPMAMLDTTLGYITNHSEYFLLNQDGTVGINGYSSSLAWHKSYWTKLIQNLRKRWPWPWFGAYNATGGFGLYDGSNPRHWGRETVLWRSLFETAPEALICANDSMDYGGVHSSGHVGALAKVKQARNWARFALSCQTPERGGFAQRGARGPVVASQGTWISDYVLRLPFTHHGGTTLFAHKSTEDNFSAPAQSTSWTEGTATPQEMTQALAIRLAGNYYTHGRIDTRSADGSAYSTPPGVAVKLERVDIDNTNHWITITFDSTSASNIKFIDGSTLSLTTAKTKGFDGFIHLDTASESTRFPGLILGGASQVFFCDDQTHDGIPYGFLMRSAVDVYFPPTNPGSQTLAAIDAIPTTAQGAWRKLTGSSGGDGLSAGADLVVKIDGVTVPTPTHNPQLPKVRHDNTWECWVPTPVSLTAGSHTVDIYRVGQGAPDQTSTINIRTAATLRGIPGSADSQYMGLTSGAANSIIGQWSGRFAWTMFQDAAGTQPVTDTMQSVFRWNDATDTTNRWVQTGAGSVYAGLSSIVGNPAPSLDLTLTFSEDKTRNPVEFYAEYSPGIFFQTYGQSLTYAGSMPASLTGDFTIMLVYWPGMNSFGITRPYLQFGGTNNGIYIYDNGNHLYIGRGNNSIDTLAALGSDIDQFKKLLIRYRVSDGLLEVYRAAYTGFNVQQSASATLAPEAMTMTGTGLLQLPWGGIWEMVVANTRFSDADRDAGLTWLSAISVG